MVAVDTSCSGSGMVVGGSVSGSVVGGSVASSVAMVGGSVGAGAWAAGMETHSQMAPALRISSTMISAINTPTMAEPCFLRLKKGMYFLLRQRHP